MLSRSHKLQCFNSFQFAAEPHCWSAHQMSNNNGRSTPATHTHTHTHRPKVQKLTENGATKKIYIYMRKSNEKAKQKQEQARSIHIIIKKKKKMRRRRQKDNNYKDRNDRLLIEAKPRSAGQLPPQGHVVWVSDQRRQKTRRKGQTKICLSQWKLVKKKRTKNLIRVKGI